MSVEKNKLIDDIQIDGANNLIMVLRDENPWGNQLNAPEEKAHLTMLQDKINACLGYIQARLYKNDYPGIEVKYAIIELRFRYEFTEHCKRYLQLVNSELEQYGIKIDVYVDKKN